MTHTTLEFVVNGAARNVAVDPDTPLIHVLRDDLQLKGTRPGCSAGACGACMVMIDGRATNSCDTPMWAVAGHAITTVEGLGTADAPHPVQQAFIDLQAAQCGYCINGIMLSVAALRQGDGAIDEAALQAALARHLCRCGTHMRILGAARRALGLDEHPS